MNQGLQRRAPMWSALAVAAALLAPGAARADLVTYSTSLTTGSSYTLSEYNIVGASADFITFNAQNSTSANTPANTAVGSFTWTNGTIGFGGYGTDQTTFDLKVTQTQPSGGFGTYSGDLTATFHYNSNTPYLQFTNTSIMIGSETYQLETKNAHGGGYTSIAANSAINLDPSQGATFTLYAGVTSSVGITSTPEPSNFLFGGFASLMALGYAWRRRKPKAASC